MQQFISELGETGRPFAGLANVWFVFVGALFMGFVVAMLKGTRRSSTVNIAALLFGIWTATGMIGGFFPCDPGCEGRTVRGAVHIVLGQVGAVCLLPVPSLVWFGVRRDPRWIGYGRFTFAVQILALASLALLGVAYFGISGLAAMLEARVGLLQRFSLGVYYVWTAIIGLKIARLCASAAKE